MAYFQAIVLGFIQGITEFLPISSSAHLIIFPEVLNWPDQSLDFDVFMHIATLLAVIIYFRMELITIIKDLFAKASTTKQHSIDLTKQLLIAFIPLFPSVFLLKTLTDLSESNVYVVLILFILFGIPLIFIEQIYHFNSKTIAELNWKNSLSIGIAQCIALFSGVSRSGITIMTGMINGLTKEAAKKFTFLLSIPTISAGLAYELLKIISDMKIQESWSIILVGFIAAFLSGLFAINLMMNILKNNSLKIFGYYRIVLGIILLIIFWVK